MILRVRAPSSFLFLVVRPGAPSSILAPGSRQRCRTQVLLHHSQFHADAAFFEQAFLGVASESCGDSGRVGTFTADGAIPGLFLLQGGSSVPTSIVKVC